MEVRAAKDKLPQSNEQKAKRHRAAAEGKTFSTPPYFSSLLGDEANGGDDDVDH